MPGAAEKIAHIKSALRRRFFPLMPEQPLAEKVLIRLAELDAAQNPQATASAAAPAIATAATDQA